MDAWRPQVRAMVFVCCLRRKSFIFCFVCHFSNVYFSFAICFCFGIPDCKTLVLDMGDERNVVTVFGFRFPIYGSTNYIASLEVINIESGSRNNGYQLSFCRLTRTLNYLLSI
ncbi:unnamed protein product [Cuscuta epithymum]|uniref:Uncharacterized protein n=1 Tax=Cuscuta epithymum TaxID=186058 RepID=A0AAV0DGT7_9ASTE|nr:unnamed protein product [Cuscuta epithymum]